MNIEKASEKVQDMFDRASAMDIPEHTDASVIDNNIKESKSTFEGTCKITLEALKNMKERLLNQSEAG